MFFAQIYLLNPVWMTAPGKKNMRAVISVVSIVLGLYLCGYPEMNVEWGAWSKQLLDIGSYIVPSGGEVSRYWCSLGATFVVFGILLNHTVQDFLCHRVFLFLGKCSFPVYLMHASLMRSVLVWFVFGFCKPRQRVSDDGKPWPGQGPRLPAASIPVRLIILPFFFALLYYLATQWNKHVEPWCAYFMQKLEAAIVGDEGRSAVEDKSHTIVNGHANGQTNGFVRGHARGISTGSSLPLTMGPKPEQRIGSGLPA
jgi:hypothetical protein